jgi:hypothetical protein
LDRSARFRFIPIGAFVGRRNITMDITVRDRSQALETVPVADEIPRRPLWPVLVIAFAISATMLWSGVLLWLLSRMIFLLVL